ncbi:Fe-Fe hydrogenase 2 [Desulforamulus profundi]|uniref:Fe-Fe hydrogenase 2 n=1 Tax=Desulforamulus profundi TaxID=1383067 RepID=A0A2C6LKS4_9FIRM|nr:[FeFe] hydrogenase, group A [Desulforamulus profundi]PHJ39190.1 Fe-Fe hydrogenase 2 [Desulforamulus profundi]
MQVVYIDQDLCTGCERCKEVCPADAISGEYGKPQAIDANKCVFCGQCIQICNAFVSNHAKDNLCIKKKKKERNMLSSVKEPLFAAYNIGHAPLVKEKLRDKSLFKMVQCAPSVRVSIGEDFGLAYGTVTPGKMAAALRRLGFDRVYDTNFGADMTIIEEVSELIKRMSEGATLPMFTSCCPAWVKYVEYFYPALIPHLSTCKSPHQMQGALMKTYGAKIDNVDPGCVYTVSVMPCTAKKFECQRPEMEDSGYRDVDAVLTTRELAYLIKEAGIDFKALPEENFDAPLGDYTGAGAIFGAAGGVMEAALRTGYEFITRNTIPKVDIEEVRIGTGVKRQNIKIGDREFRVVIVAGLKNARPLLEQVKEGKADFDFMEVMACPAGCISGGGQPKVVITTDNFKAYEARKRAIYQHDKNLPFRKSHENPSIKKIYEEFLKEPLGEKSHHLLHTSYIPRS